MTALAKAIEAVRELAEASAINNGWGISEERATDFARAVLMAVREPDLAMRRVSTFVAAEEDWPAMIDAILNATPDPGAGG